jgi:hypothetical protein
MILTKRQLDVATRWYLQVGTDIVTCVDKLKLLEQHFAERSISHSVSDCSHLEEMYQEIHTIQNILSEIQAGLRNKLKVNL